MTPRECESNHQILQILATRREQTDSLSVSAGSFVGEDSALAHGVRIIRVLQEYVRSERPHAESRAITPS